MSNPRHPILLIEKIVSGGQTGADRAALDSAIEHGVPHGGWCPKGELAEDSAIPSRYALREMCSKDYLRGTEQNIRLPHSPTPIPVLTVPGAADEKPISYSLTP